MILSLTSHPADLLTITRRRIGWYLGGRVITAALILVGTITYQQIDRANYDFDPLHWLYLFALLFGIESLVAFLLSRFLRHTELLLQSQIAWDLLFTTLLVFLTGGIESPFVFLFILVILSASVFLQQRQTLIVAAASAILYGSLIDLQYFGYLPPTSSHPTLRTVLYAVYANILAFFLTAILGGILSTRLRKSEEALKEKEIDYEELERLNRAIVANIGSGLLTITPDGKIRVFNQGAERIIGMSQSEVYDRDVREILPGLKIFDGTFIHTCRDEGIFIDGNGKKLSLGFNTTLIAGVDKKEDNLLLSFQDLTHLKEIEEQLRRSDRLVAVGQLSAGLAHEIRNPLASISGSVQLLLEEGTTMPANDQRLLQIVLREAERLNLLLGDFLRFARPTPPTLEHHDIAKILDDLIEVVKGDPRFSGIHFLKEYSTNEFLCDDGQLRQALLNLVINAAEALSGVGIIRLHADTDPVSIRVEDSGPGLLPEVQKQLFNPFFTTKEDGTGLGLATVHAIVSAHGGKIEVTRSSLGGAAFTLSFRSTQRY